MDPTVSSSSFISRINPHRLPILCLALLVWVSPLAAQVDPEKRVTAHRIESGIVVDGELDEAEWQLAEPASGFVQQDPQTGEPSTENTEVRILYDEDNLYVGAHLFDSAGGDAIIINDMRRDFFPFPNDTFIVVLDTFNDNRNAFFFSVNASGAKFDMQASDDGRKLREVSSNIRFNIIHKPLSDFFLVYNERRSSTREVIERALIAKLTYVFSF